MKKFIIIFLIGICYVITAQSQWVLQYTSQPAQTVMALKFYNDLTGYYAGVIYSGSTYNIHKTTNGGVNFIDQNSHIQAQRFMATWIFHPDTVLFAGNYGKIIKTVDGGNNWSLIYADTNKQFWCFYFVNNNTGYVSGSMGTIMKTTNKGNNWTILPTPTTTALDGMWFVNETTGYCGGANIFLKTTDAGATWVNKVGNFISPFETAEGVYFSDVNTGYYCTNTSTARIVKTTNGGDNWIVVHDSAGFNGAWAMSFPNPTTGYVSTGAGTVLKTTNAGSNWFVQTTPLTENLYEIHFPSVNTGYIASWSGKILKTTNGGVTFVSKTNNEVPSYFKLEQNYPNPFNPNTNISFAVPSRTYVKIQVYDITGRIVSELINETLDAGNYQVSFNGANSGSGIYYYRMIAGNYIDTKKMILVK